MDEKQRAYRISEVARELGIYAEWLRKGEERDFFPRARRDPHNNHRYYTRRDIERLKSHRAARTLDGR